MNRGVLGFPVGKQAQTPVYPIDVLQAPTYVTSYKQAGRTGQRWVGNPVPPVAPGGWWDFSDPSTVTVTGSGISAITDKSGNGRTFTQGTDGNRPPYNTWINGKRVAGSFSGDWMAASWTVSRPFSFIIVAQSSSTVENAFVNNTATNGVVFRINGLLQTVIAGSATEFHRKWPLQANELIVCGVIIRSTTVEFHANGSYWTISNSGVPNAGNIDIGRRQGGGNYQGYMGEILAWDTDITIPEYRAVEEWLAWKWKIPIIDDHRLTFRVPG